MSKWSNGGGGECEVPCWWQQHRPPLPFQHTAADPPCCDDPCGGGGAGDSSSDCYDDGCYDPCYDDDDDDCYDPCTSVGLRVGKDTVRAAIKSEKVINRLGPKNIKKHLATIRRVFFVTGFGEVIAMQAFFSQMYAIQRRLQSLKITKRSEPKALKNTIVAIREWNQVQTAGLAHFKRIFDRYLAKIVSDRDIKIQATRAAAKTATDAAKIAMQRIAAPLVETSSAV
jgi:hypothetical protein